METRIVTIDLDVVSYDIYVGSGLLYRLADFVPAELKGRSVFIIADKNVRSIAARMQGNLLESGAGRAEIFTLPPGEKTKSIAQAEDILSWLLDSGVTRSSILFAVGGGVAGDITGFCASVILRGIPFVQVPTTLLSQVDSSVGGKTGINMKQGKNMIGTFYQPAAVIADIETLKTLPGRELVAGYAEIVKYGLINDMGFFNWLEQNGRKVCALDDDAVAHAIENSVRAKGLIVQADEKETADQRALLNLGHTFGHALETAAKYDGRLLHGEAVAIGMIMAFDLSVRMGLCPADHLERVAAHFESVGLPTRASFIDPALNTGIDGLMDIMGRDKKATDKGMRFILVRGIGEAFVSTDVPPDLVRAVLKDSLGENAGGGSRWKQMFSSHS